MAVNSVAAENLVVGVADLILEDIYFSLNSGGQIVVTAGSNAKIKYYDAGDGQNVTVSLTAGTTAYSPVSAGTTRYVFFNKDNVSGTAPNYTLTNFNSTTSFSTATSNNRRIVASHEGGEPNIAVRTGGSGSLNSVGWNSTTKEGWSLSVDSVTGSGTIEGNALRLYNTNAELIFSVDGSLNVGVPIFDGTNNRNIPVGVETGVCRDGEAVTFAQEYGDVPTVIFGAGGVTSDSGLTGQVALRFEPQNISTTGFTPSLRLVELAGSPTTTTDNTDITALQQDREIQKSTATEAFDDIYNFKFTVRVTNQSSADPGIDFNPGVVTVGIFAYDQSAATWTKYATRFVYGSTSSSTTDTTATKAVTIDGLNSTSDRFGITIESDLYGGSSFIDTNSGVGGNQFLEVTYEADSAPASSTATPSGAPAVPYIVVGNPE